MTTAADRAWQLMRDRVLAHDRRAQVAEALGMSFVRVKALRRVVAGGPVGVAMSVLTTAVAVDKAYTTLIVDDLEKRGLVVRTPNPADRRAKLVTATPAGEREAARAASMLDEPPPELVALGAADQAELLRLLGLITPGDG
jgi:DNA-binding MarR family transcriptional regulator